MNQITEKSINQKKIVIISPADIESFGGNIISLVGIASALEFHYKRKPTLICLSKNTVQNPRKVIEEAFEEIFYIKRSSLIKSLFSRESFKSILFKRYKSDLSEEIKNIIYDAEIIVSSHLMTTACFADLPTKADIRICFVEVLESRIWRELKNGWNFKSFLRRLVTPSSIRADEFNAAKYYTRCISYSEIEASESNYKLDYFPFPYNRDLDNTSAQIIKSESGQNISEDIEVLNVGFVGNLEWEPNLRSAYGLIDFSKSRIDLQIYIAGKSTDSLRSNVKASNINVLGEIENLSDLYKHCDLMWCEVETNGGVRVKVVEALCMGKLPVCHKQSLEGIPEHLKKFHVEPDNILANSARIRVLIDELKKRNQEINRIFSSRHLSDFLFNK